MTPNDVRILLEAVIDTDLDQTLGSLGAVHDVEVTGNRVRVFLDAIQPLHWAARRLDHDCKATILGVYPDSDVEILVRERGSASRRTAALAGIKNLIAVASGKGGVGKSTVAANLAAALAQRGASVGLLDADIYGPSQPTMYGLSAETMRAEKTEDGKVIGYPNEAYGVKVASIGFVMQRDQAAILRGPMLAGYFTMLVEQIVWGELDYLIFDLPPGTGDIQLTLTQRIPLTGAVVVTTPQEIALADVRRSIQMFSKVNVDVLGVVENMSYFVPPDLPDRRYHIFGQGGGQTVAKEFSVPFLGELPIDIRVREGADEGFPFVLDPESGLLGDAFRVVAENVVREVRRANARSVDSSVEISL
ncbi:MAG: Mrp/NBP35 family ATP-binding protein [Candidatus Kapabacteria bacterium]|nr:Mrp/NBP35 family ATP-binding protein [Candidatus Kapabacteria bacterium]